MEGSGSVYLKSKGVLLLIGCVFNIGPNIYEYTPKTNMADYTGIQFDGSHCDCIGTSDESHVIFTADIVGDDINGHPEIYILDVIDGVDGINMDIGWESRISLSIPLLDRWL